MAKYMPPGTKPLPSLAGHKQGAPADSGLTGHMAEKLTVPPARMDAPKTGDATHLFGSWDD